MLLILLALPLYIAGYAWARENKWLIHRTTYSTVGDRKHYVHAIELGDLGIGITMGPVLPWLAAGCHLIFTPLRWAEAGYWNTRQG